MKCIKGLVDKVATMQVFGCLMKNTLLLANVDRYRLDPYDFDDRFSRLVFVSIFNMYGEGARVITPIDIDNYLNASSKEVQELFKSGNGIQYVNDCEELAEIDNFDFYYSRVKKFSALRSLEKDGFDISEFWCENPLDKNYSKIQDRFNKLTVQEIFDEIKRRLFGLESKFISSANRVSIDMAEGLDELIEDFKLHPEVGAPIQGEILNSVIRGARKGKYTIRSASSNTGKSRLAVGDACYLSIPIHYDSRSNSWVERNYCEKSLVITTEMEVSEIQTLIFSWITGINEETILNGTYTQEELQRVEIGKKIAKTYKDNLQLEHLPDPSIEQIKALCREQVLTNNIQNIFYDYIYSSPGLIKEFSDSGLREDVVLMMLSTALKDIAVELNVYMQTSTQLSGDYENKRGIRNEKYLQGSKAIVNKCDVGMITLWIPDEERNIITKVVDKMGCPMPTHVTDIYKGRRGRYKNVKIWSVMDLGTCKVHDVFITDGFYNPIPDFKVFEYSNIMESVWENTSSCDDKEPPTQFNLKDF